MNNREGDINYWPCISDMFLVFFIMAMAIVITTGGYETAGDKFVIDDVVRDYQFLVEKVEKVEKGDAAKNAADCYYLPKGSFQMEAEGDSRDPEPDAERRPLLRLKMLQLLRVIDASGFCESGTYRKKMNERGYLFYENGMPRFEVEGSLDVGAYPFDLPAGVTGPDAIAQGYRQMLSRLEQTDETAEGQFSYGDALRLLAFRVLCEPEANLRGADNATLMRKLCMAFDTDDGVAAGSGADLKDQLEALKKQLAQKAEELKVLQEKNRELERQQAANKRMEELLQELCRITGVQRDSDLPAFISRLMKQDGMEALQQEVRNLKKKIADLQAQLEKANRLAAMLGSSTLDEATLSKIVAYLKIGLNARPYATCLDEKDGTFSSGSAQFKANSSGRTKIAELVRQLEMKAQGTNGPAAYEVVVVGFSDAEGKVDENILLGMQRSLAIKNVILSGMHLNGQNAGDKLVFQYKGNYVKFSCYSGGSLNPLDPANPASPENRRVDVKIAPGSVNELQAEYAAQQAAAKAKENRKKEEDKKTGASRRESTGGSKTTRKGKKGRIFLNGRWIEVDTTNPNVVDE